MRLLLQLFRRGRTPDVDPHVYLRLLIVLLIVVFCGPEVFAAADLIALLDLMGTILFLTAFAVGFRALGPAVVTCVQRIFLPADWTALIKMRGYPSFVAHGLILVGANILFLSLVCLITTLRVLDVAHGL
jgi:hypothetical protein